MASPQDTTEDGFDLQLGTNHVGHFLLAELLTPALLAGAPSRVISLSSAGHRFSPVDLEDPGFATTEYEPWVAYGRSKTANALFAVGYDARYGEQGVHAFSLHPGGIQTELGRHLTEDSLKTLMDAMPKDEELIWKSIPQGAATTCWAATAPELDARGGAYLEDCGIAHPMGEGPGRGYAPYAVDSAAAERLWAMSETMVGQSFSY